MSQPKKKKKLHIDSELRIFIFAWCLVMGMMLLLGATYAWYSLNSRVAETVAPNVMKPYQLRIDDSQGAAAEQISVGALQQGETKQIVFSVTNEEEPQKNQNKTAFAYALELIYTNNIALKYEVYPLHPVEVLGENTLVTEEILQIQQGEGENATVEEQVITYYWEKDASALSGKDISTTRHPEAGVMGTEINRGTYISYEKRTGDDGITILNENMVLDAGEEAYATQFYVLEIQWNITSGFEKYDKETDMIYIVAKAVQPKPATASQ